MRRILFNAGLGVAVLAAVLLVARNFASIVAAGASYAAAQQADSVESTDPTDSTRVPGFETTINGEDGEGVRIRINEEGISIEGKDFDLDDLDDEAS